MSGAPYTIPAMPLCLGTPSSLVLGLNGGWLLLSEDKQNVRGAKCCCQWYQPGLDMAGTMKEGKH